jgi:hypothetical protein
MTVRCFGISPLVGVDLHWESRAPPSSAAPQSSECCDVCGTNVPTGEVYFDGKSFVCRACRFRRLNMKDQDGRMPE